MWDFFGGLRSDETNRRVTTGHELGTRFGCAVDAGTIQWMGEKGEKGCQISIRRAVGRASR